jgi:hypothetical protein
VVISWWPTISSLKKENLMQLTLPSGAVIHPGRDITKIIGAKRATHYQKLDSLKAEIAKSKDLEQIKSAQAETQAKIEVINAEAQAIGEILEFKANAIKAAGNYLIDPNASESMLKYVDPDVAMACRTLKGASAYFGDSRRNIGRDLIAHADELLALAKAANDGAQKSKSLLRVIARKLDYHIVKKSHIHDDVETLIKLHGGALKELQEKTAKLAQLREAALAGDWDSELAVQELHPEVLELRKTVMGFIRKYNHAQMSQKQEATSQFRFELTTYRKSAFGKSAPIDLARELDADIGETL